MKNYSFMSMNNITNNSIEDEEEAYDEDIEEDYDEEIGLQSIFPKIKFQQQIIKKIENWDSEYLD